ncbi:MAG TPA: type II toxin-antitoxin system prevent-host-death family antitoxin [Ilumatobacter sp.]|jgi:prevent-host-death family protein|nr:type II toxin-antitoxin system prevent-host-death family antitoxin [Ilumatobacter sp.]
MDVGVRELKAKLSAMLQRAAAGEVITVTDRGRPVATLGPPLGGFDLTAAVEAGWVTPPTSSGLGPVRRYRASAPVLDVLAEDRRE